jgi:hypothetical protein
MHQGERHGEDGAALGHIPGMDLSAMHADDPLGNGKAQATPLSCPRLVSPIEAIEDPR